MVFLVTVEQESPQQLSGELWGLHGILMELFDGFVLIQQRVDFRILRLCAGDLSCRISMRMRLIATMLTRRMTDRMRMRMTGRINRRMTDRLRMRMTRRINRMAGRMRLRMAWGISRRMTKRRMTGRRMTGRRMAWMMGRMSHRRGILSGIWNEE